MAEPFQGELRVFPYSFAPKGWALCNGQLLAINQNQALFSLLGTMYGGDGRVNFALPDLRGRVPMHVGAGYIQGERAGEASHTLVAAELPTHTHAVRAASAPAKYGAPGPTRALAQAKGAAVYGAPTNLTAMDPSALSSIGGSQPHENMQPYLTLNFCIALFGIFPSRN